MSIVTLFCARTTVLRYSNLLWSRGGRRFSRGCVSVGFSSWLCRYHCYFFISVANLTLLIIIDMLMFEVVKRPRDTTHDRKVFHALPTRNFILRGFVHLFRRHHLFELVVVEVGEISHFLQTNQTALTVNDVLLFSVFWKIRCVNYGLRPLCNFTKLSGSFIHLLITFSRSSGLRSSLSPGFKSFCLAIILPALLTLSVSSSSGSKKRTCKPKHVAAVEYALPKS